jgi:large subunit ribosomal protein L9
VLVLEDHEHLGEVGDVVDVKPGYARNLLFPTGLACPVSDAALRDVERRKKHAAKKRAERAVAMEALAKTVEGVTLTLEERAGEDGRLFGSVGASQIVEALAAKGIAVEERKVVLEEPIKELGIFRVPIRIDAERSAEIRVWVIEPTQ